MFCGAYLELILVHGQKSVVLDGLLLSSTDIRGLAVDDVVGVLKLGRDCASVVGDGLVESFVGQLHASASEEKLLECQPGLNSGDDGKLTLLPTKQRSSTPSYAFSVFLCPAFFVFLGADAPSEPASAARLVPLLCSCQ